MGSGKWTREKFNEYASGRYGISADELERADLRTQDVFRQRMISSLLNPRAVIRQCCDSEEHPGTLPVILALDVTGSMGKAAVKTATSLNSIMTGIFSSDKIKDVEFCVMAIGDIHYDRAPIQISQFESDIRIAEQLDAVYFEGGGGGNSYESYTAAWYMALRHCELDCWKRGGKGLIITMGDEPLNPILERHAVEGFLGDEAHVQGNVETKKLYNDASKKFDIYHISIDDRSTCYRSYKDRIENTFGQLLGDHAKVASIDALPNVIEACISETIAARNGGAGVLNEGAKTKPDGTITW